MRNFVDSHGTEWTVFEVKRQVVGTSGRSTYLPGGLSHGWLCFESDIGKRRLARFPSEWRRFADQQLEELLEQAQLARPTRWSDVGSEPRDDAGDAEAR